MGQYSIQTANVANRMGDEHTRNQPEQPPELVMWFPGKTPMVNSDDLGQMKFLNLAVVGAFAGGVAGALIGASTMFALDSLVPQTAIANTIDSHAARVHASMP